MKRKFLFIMALILVISNTLFSQEKVNIFTSPETWEKITERARLENKYIFVDVYATWCFPCKLMDTEVYNNPSIIALLKENFISFKVQHDQNIKDTEDVKALYKDANSFVVRYNVESLPTFLFFSPDGKLIHRSTGFQDTTTFRKTIDLAFKNPLNDFRSKFDLYKKGKKDSIFLRTLSQLALQIDDNFNASLLSADYIRSLSSPLQKDNLEYIFSFTKKSTDPGFRIIFNNLNQASKIMGAKPTYGLIRKIIGKEEIEPFLANKIIEWEKLADILMAKYGQVGIEKLNGVKMAYYLNKRDWANFGKAYAKYYQTAIRNSEYHINNLSWAVFEKVTDRKILKVAIKAAQYNAENIESKDPGSVDTYANLLYKAGYVRKAIQVEKKAVALSNGEKVFVEILQKMQKGQPTWVP